MNHGLPIPILVVWIHPSLVTIFHFPLKYVTLIGMKLPRPDFGKLSDIARKNQKIFIALLVAIPLISLLVYLFKPDRYALTFKLRMNAVYAYLALDENPKKAIERSLADPAYFSSEEAPYFKEHSALEEENPHTFLVNISDENRHRLSSNASRIEEMFAWKFGKCKREDLPVLIRQLEESIEKEKEEKAALENELKNSEETSLQSSVKDILARISVIDEQIAIKQRQLDIILPKVGSRNAKDLKDPDIFRSKSASLDREIGILQATKQDLNEKHDHVVKKLEGLGGVTDRIMAIERSMDMNTKRLALLNELDTGGTALLDLPYQYQAQIIERSKEPLKIYSRTSIRKRLLLGLALSLLVISLITFYNIAIDPVISSIEDLEKLTNLKVLGAIQEIKRKNP